MQSAVIGCPFPFPDHEATAQVKIIQEVDTEDQEPQELLIYEGTAVYCQETTSTFNADSKRITLSGDLIIKGDVQNTGELSDVRGYVVINGVGKKQIYKMSKPQVMGMIYSTEVTLK